MDQLHSLTLSDVLAEAAASYPLRTAVVDGDLRLSYPEFGLRVRRAATVLRAHGATEGDRVLWLGQNSSRVLELLYACAELGAVFGPWNWRQSADELGFVLDDTAPAVVIADTGGAVAATIDAARHAGHGAAAAWLDSDKYDALVSSASADEGEAPWDALAPVLLMYTAAFDGRPKAALLPHCALVAQDVSIGRVQDITADTVYLNCGPLFHIATLMSTLATVHFGGTNVFTAKSDAAELLRLIEDERCTDAFLLPPTMDTMIELNREAGHDLSSLRSIPYKAEWNEMVSVLKSDWALRPGGYGQTEVAGLATCTAVGGDAIGTHGRPGPLARVRVVDPDGNEVAHGQVGELQVKGPLVMAGYLDRADETQRRQAGGWHHTNDLARREEDGSLSFIGPMARLIKSAAENIYPAEVERALAEHPAVAEACVIGVPDPKWAQSVHAVVVLAGGADVTGDELIAHCKARIASYKKPKDVVFTDALPRTEQGIVDRDAVDAAFGGGGYPGSNRDRTV